MSIFDFQLLPLAGPPAGAAAAAHGASGYGALPPVNAAPLSPRNLVAAAARR